MLLETSGILGPQYLFARTDFANNKRRWLRSAVNHVSVELIVSADVCMQGVQGSNPTDDWSYAEIHSIFCPYTFIKVFIFNTHHYTVYTMTVPI